MTVPFVGSLFQILLSAFNVFSLTLFIAALLAPDERKMYLLAGFLVAYSFNLKQKAYVRGKIGEARGEEEVTKLAFRVKLPMAIFNFAYLCLFSLFSIRHKDELFVHLLLFLLLSTGSTALTLFLTYDRSKPDYTPRPWYFVSTRRMDRYNPKEYARSVDISVGLFAIGILVMFAEITLFFMLNIHVLLKKMPM